MLESKKHMTKIEDNELKKTWPCNKTRKFGVLSAIWMYWLLNCGQIAWRQAWKRSEKLQRCRGSFARWTDSHYYLPTLISQSIPVAWITQWLPLEALRPAGIRVTDDLRLRSWAVAVIVCMAILSRIWAQFDIVTSSPSCRCCSSWEICADCCSTLKIAVALLEGRWRPQVSAQSCKLCFLQLLRDDCNGLFFMLCILQKMPIGHPWQKNGTCWRLWSVSFWKLWMILQLSEPEGFAQPFQSLKGLPKPFRATQGQLAKQNWPKCAANMLPHFTHFKCQLPRQVMGFWHSRLKKLAPRCRSSGERRLSLLSCATAGCLRNKRLTW